MDKDTEDLFTTVKEESIEPFCEDDLYKIYEYAKKFARNIENITIQSGSELDVIIRFAIGIVVKALNMAGPVSADLYYNSVENEYGIKVTLVDTTKTKPVIFLIRSKYLTEEINIDEFESDLIKQVKEK